MSMRFPLVLGAIIISVGLGLSMLLADYQLRLLKLAVISAIAVMGLNFAFGYAGLISLGHAAFVGTGAYGVALLTTLLAWSWLALPVAVAGTAIFALSIGFPLLRLKGHYLALATLGLNVSFSIVAANWIELTGGTNGVSRIPELPIAGHALAYERSYLGFALVVLALSAAIAALLHVSRLGRAMIAVRDDETASSMTGIDVSRVKLAAFVLSSVYAALAGSLFAFHMRFISPDDFGYAHSITYLAMLVIGGEGSVVGAILGALLVTFLPEWLRFLGSAYLAFFGVFVLAILVFLPSGLAGISRPGGIRRDGGIKKLALVAVAKEARP
ncbi:branched-chain amino acid transport system permease protein [Bradyrhizobium sp. CIR18]|uniref:branched-chain amino acid ABC transporter permease n=1 Tax=Bradyrhizobium sp. CIR18 TaxID=2663839 RepID=UPI001605E948|nr:branched-chain amino acid ABC transporter permease [Bradyrhizobium sp. CIR18]MBB4363089.1 branched-chain amino acid transport system permease protein [Bradyrhizobium sp. CIR18]